MIISWPTNSVPFVLQSATELTSEPLWKDVETPPALTNGHIVLPNPRIASTQFHQLKGP